MQDRKSLLKSPFHKAAVFGVLVALAALAAQCPASAETAKDVSLILAIGTGDDAQATLLLREGASANAYEAAWPNRTALMLAAWFGRERVLPELLSHGADVNARDQNGETPLMWSLQAPLGGLECTTLLLNHGADVNAADRGGKTALMYAIGLPDMMASVRTTFGLSKAMRVRMAVDPKAVRLLLAHKADANAKDKNGETALMEAAKSGRLDLVKLLVGAGAQPNVEDQAGHNAQWYAEQAGHKDIAQFLAKTGG